MGRVIDALVAYRVIKLLVTPFNKTQAYKMGIIDEKGKVLIKSRDFMKAFPNSAITLWFSLTSVISFSGI